MSLALADRAIGRCRTLARYSEQEGRTTRPFLCASMRGVHDAVADWMRGAGMTVRLDAVGNVRGTYASAGSGPLFLIGSHLDTVPNAGAFDGVLGVVLGVTLVEMLERRRLPFQIEVIGFSDEEGVRFGTPFIGSRAVAGSLSEEVLERKDAGGLRVRDAIRDYGLDPDRLADARVADTAIGYLEIHIEQGPVLDQLGIPLGVVDAIAGQSRLDVTFTGAGGHAGTTPMAARRDALAGAAEWMVRVEDRGCRTPGLVATVGRVDVSPNATNVIADRCTASLDVRHADDAVRTDAVHRLVEAARAIGTRRGLDVTWTVALDQPAVAMDRGLSAALERAATCRRTPIRRLASGAGHDAMVLAARMPTSMLFVRSPGGTSHHPDETVVPADVAAALETGVQFLEELVAHHA